MMSGKIKNNYKEFLILFPIILFYIIGFLLNEDASGSGEYDYINYLLVSQENLSNSFYNTLTNEGFSGYTPLHFILYSPLYNVFGAEYLRLINYLSSFFVIYIFYLLLKKKFPEIKKNHLILISLLPTLDPYFRASAYWFQNEITALIFFLISLNFFLNFDNNKNLIKTNIINKDIIFSFVFCALAFYTKQNYVIFVIFYFIYYLIKIKNFKFFLTLSILNILIYLPYFYLSLKLNSFTPGAGNQVYLFSLNNILIFFSILSFYFFPFYIFKINKNFLNNNKYKFILSILFVLIFSYFFKYENNLGGGFFYKLSNLILDNNFFFFISSSIGLFFFIDLVFSKNLKNKLIFFPILLILIFLKVPYQEYIAIYFFYIYFLILDKDFINNIFYRLSFNLSLIYFYFIIFLIGSILYNHLNLKYLI